MAFDWAAGAVIRRARTSRACKYAGGRAQQRRTVHGCQEAQDASLLEVVRASRDYEPGSPARRGTASGASATRPARR